jgi:signal peptidase I
MNLFPFGNQIKLKRFFAFPQPSSQDSDSSLKEIILFGLFALAIIIPLRYFVITPFIVNGSSMDPTFKHNDYLIVNRLSTRFFQPDRFDVVVFKYPLNPDKFFIKRIIGLPEERIVISKGKVKIFNTDHPEGFFAPPPFLDISTEGSVDITLGKGEFFVLGDNRQASSDSRYWGALNEDFLVGEPIIRLFPLSSADVSPGKEKRD